jgi:hypothetical protein
MRMATPLGTAYMRVWNVLIPLLYCLFTVPGMLSTFPFMGFASGLTLEEVSSAVLHSTYFDTRLDAPSPCSHSPLDPLMVTS